METTTLIYKERKLQSRTIGQPKWTRITLLIVLGYEAAGAMLGGFLLIAAPDGRLMDMPVEMMHGVFSDFLIPGIILLGLGILNAVAFISVLRKISYDWVMAGLAVGGLAIWFIVEIIILQELHWLHLMWGFPVFAGCIVSIPLIVSRHESATTRDVLLVCGILSSLWYVAINIYVPIQYEGYRFASYTVSELSALGTPTRITWVLMVIIYPLLFAAFGWGVIKSTGENRLLRILGVLIITYSLFNFYWPPMHQRGTEPTLTDTLHIIWAMTTVILMMIMMGFGAAALGKVFRLFTLISLGFLILFGVLTSSEAPNIPSNGPTPMIGVWERINIGIFMIWVIVLASFLLKKEKRVINSGRI